MDLDTFSETKKAWLDVATKPLDEILRALGRTGGPSEYGWHVYAPEFRCWFEWHLSTCKQKGSGGPTSLALAIGGLVHELLAIRYLKQSADRGEQLLDAARKEGYADAADEAVRLFDAYKVRWTNDPWLDTEVVAVENELRRDFPWGDPYTCRADLVLKLADGYWVVDHKTAAMRSVEYVDGWQVDPQILGTMWIAQRYYKPLRGVIINGIVKTKVPQFDRFQFAVDKRMIREWLHMMRAQWMIRETMRVAGWPKNFASCVRRFGKCEYFERCVYGVK